ncbi:MAG: hypothetical protein ACE5FT_04260 [Candidatus Nanoarchaeia archaeon]
MNPQIEPYKYCITPQYKIETGILELPTGEFFPVFDQVPRHNPYISPDFDEESDRLTAPIIGLNNCRLYQTRAEVEDDLDKMIATEGRKGRPLTELTALEGPKWSMVSAAIFERAEELSRAGGMLLRKWAE